MTVRRWIGVAAALLTLSTGCSSSTESEPAGAAPPASTTPTPTTTSPPPDLQAVLDAFADDQSVPFSVVAVDLATGARGERLADRQVPSASLYKLFVARELLRRIDVEDLDREAPAHDGEGHTVGECIEAMIVVSDNRCGAAGLNAVGHGAIDAELHEAGFVSTSLATPQRTSAADVALFLARTRDGTLLGTGGEDVTAELYGLLRTQAVNDRLPLGLDPGTPIAHKTGDILHWAHDAGIVTTPTGELLVVVLSGPWPSPCCDADHPGKAEAKAFGAIAQLATQLYAAVS